MGGRTGPAGEGSPLMPSYVPSPSKRGWAPGSPLCGRPGPGAAGPGVPGGGRASAPDRVAPRWRPAAGGCQARDPALLSAPGGPQALAGWILSSAWPTAAWSPPPLSLLSFWGGDTEARLGVALTGCVTEALAEVLCAHHIAGPVAAGFKDCVSGRELQGWGARSPGRAAQWPSGAQPQSPDGQRPRPASLAPSQC